MSNGIITYADSEQYVKQAVLLALTARKNSNLNTSIVVTDDQLTKDFKQYFDKIYVLEKVDYLERGLLNCLTASEYDKTLFLYSDTLILSDISNVFQLLDYNDLVLNKELMDFKGSKITRPLYEQRKIIVRNKLPDVWTNAILYKKSQDFMDLTKLTHRIVTFWRQFKEQFLPEYAIDDKLNLKFNVAFSLALKLSDIQYYPSLTLTTLSKQEENTASMAWANLEWFKFLNAWILDNQQIKVENYIQTGIWHYGKNWINEEIYDRILLVYA